MILNRLTVVNVGVYRGRHEFNLRPQGTGPIVIFGGKNGAGKTTLLEAIRLCLHGPRALDEHTSRSVKREGYKQYLRERIHHNANGVLPPDWASIELEFEYAIAGERYIYTVERSWRDNGKGIEETLRVRQDPEPPDEMEPLQWEAFMHGLIPPALTRLFFFDGEKIQALANGSRDAQRIALSHTMKSLIGLDLVEQLQADLSTYRRRQQKDNPVDGAQQRIQVLEDALIQLETEENDLLAQLEALGAQIETMEAKIALQEVEITRVGGNFAQQRDAYKMTQVRIKTDIEGTEQAIRDLCAGLLPFAITPLYTAAVKTQLLREAEYQRWLASKSFIEQKLEEIQDEVTSEAFWQGTGADALFGLQEAVGKRVVETLQRMVEPPDAVRDIALRHHTSEPERRQLLNWIEESQTTVPDQLKTLTAHLLQLKAELERTDLALQSVPEDDVLAPLVKTLNELHQALGGLVQTQRHVEENLHRIKLQGEALNRDLHRAREDKAARQKLAEKIQRVMDVQLVLDDFATQLARWRVSQLEEVFTRNFNQLCRKEHLLEQAEIDAEDFSVTLVGASGKRFSQSELSAGERQIYAIALLWALRQVSGRPLPVLIDTPLGRLDSDHRRNLAEHYFPYASHQVILYSTDTEVDAGLYEMLQNHISHAYHLDYDQAQKATRVSQGYFWRADGGEGE